MDTNNIAYRPKYHPETAKLVHQALTSFIGLLVITLLTLGTIWFTTQKTSSPVILGTQTDHP